MAHENIVNFYQLIFMLWFFFRFGVFVITQLGQRQLRYLMTNNLSCIVYHHNITSFLTAINISSNNNKSE